MENLSRYIDALIGSLPSIAPAQLEEFLQSLPAAAYTCDAEGKITYFNEAAEALWGRAPRLHDEQELYCGAIRMRDSQGNLIPRTNCWMAQSIREAKPVTAQLTRIERPNGEQVDVLSHAHPLFDDASRLRGGVNLFWQRTFNSPLSHSVKLLSQIAPAQEGADFLVQLTRSLCQICGVSYGVVVSFDEDRPLIGTTLAFTRRGEMLENVEYDVRGTPCERIHSGEYCYYDAGIVDRFPDDRMLAEFGIGAYMGLPLFANDGRVIGLIALLHESRIPDPASAETLLRIVGLRVSAELDRRRMDCALRQQQIRFKSVFENASESIFLLDSQANVIDLNRQACLSLKYERHELMGCKPFKFDPDVTPEALEKLLARQASGEAITFESRHKTKHGDIFPVEVRLRSFWESGERFVIAIVIDLRERYAAAAALNAAQQRLELVLDAAQIGFWEWNAATERVFFSNQWRRQLGYPETDAPATLEFWKTRIHSDDLPNISGMYFTMKSMGVDAQQVEVRVRRVDGGWRWIQLRGKAIRDERGELKRIVGLHLDNTPRKRAELALEHQKSILERIAKGESIRVVLDSIVEYVESQVAESQGSIMLLRGEHLWFAAGCKIPTKFSQAIDGVKIGPNVGSCGSAAYRAKTVIVSDIATDPLWEGYRETAMAFGFRACWSAPILAGKVAGAGDSIGRVLGTFAIYSGAVGRPSSEDIEVVANAAYLAGIAIERANSEEALRDSESRLAAVIANSPGVAIQFYDSRERIVLWNRASEEMFGVRASDAMGKNLSELEGIPEELSCYREACQQIDRTGLPVGPREFSFHRKDGGQGIAISTQFSIPGPNGENWYVCMDVDITERKNSEEAVRQSREMLQLILDNIPQGVVWKDRNSRYLGLNAVVAKAMNVEKQNPIGLTDLELNMLTREQAEFFMLKDREVMDQDRAQYQIVEPINTDNKGLIWLNTNKIPLHDAAGKVTGVLVTWEDFTEKRKSQELLQHNMMLLRKTQTIAKMTGWSYDLESRKFQVADDALGIPSPDVSESTEADLMKLVHPDDFDRVKLAWSKAISGEVVEFENRLCVDGSVFWVSVRAEPQKDESGRLIRILGIAQDITDKKRLESQIIQAQKYEGIGVLAAGIAHEFNNILTSVLGNAELGLMQSPADSPVATIFGEIGKSARRAAGLTKQMLAYSGRGQMQLAPIQLSAIVQDAALVLHSIAEKQQAELVFRLESSAAVGDTIQLRLVVLQLVSNAVEALEPKAGKVVITTGEVVLTEADLTQEFALPPKEIGKYALLEVSDNGCGMSAEVVGKIFDPFFGTKFAGRGLGLAAVLGIVKRHKGAMQVRTAPGAGATIRVLLPQVLSLSDSATDPPRSSASVRPPCVLLVEDELTVREFLTHLLTGAGYQVIAAGDGAEGIELASKHCSQIQLVLLDVLMPKIDGWAACGPLRQIMPSTPIILMTGYGETPESESRLKAMSPSAFLAKPFRPSQLFAVMKQVLAASADA